MTDDIYSGDYARIEFTVYQSDGSTPLDLTNQGIMWALAPRVDETPLVTKDSANTSEIEIVDALNGRFDVILNPADTSGIGGRDYYHEVELTDANGNPHTVFTGTLPVKQTLID